MTPVPLDSAVITQMVGFYDTSASNFPILEFIGIAILALNIGIWGFRFFTGILKDIPE